MIRPVVLCSLLLASATALVAVSVPVAADETSFRTQVAPILVRRCLGCHDNRKTEGRYALHNFEQLLKPGESGESPIVPGKPNESYLFQKLIESDRGLRMPQQDDPLNPAEIDLFRSWIEQGAKFEGPAVTDRLVSLLPPRQHPQPLPHYPRPVSVFAIRFSPQGETLYTGGAHEVLVWDSTTGDLQRRIAGMPQRIHAIRFSPDGETMAVAGGAPGEYGEIRLVKLANNTTQVLPAWEDVVLDVAFSADSRQLVAGGADNSVRAYDIGDAEHPRLLWRNQQHVDWVTALDITDYQFAEEYVSNANLPAPLELNDEEKTSGQHLRQHWEFPLGRYIVRRANWELDVNGDVVIGLTRVTVSGIGTTYKVKRDPIPRESWSEQMAVIDVLRSLHRDWDRSGLESPFVVSSSRDRTVKVFALKTGSLLTTYKGHRREYGPMAGMNRVFGVQAEPGSRRVWSGGEGHHFHGWNPIMVRDEDGTAADMESRFAKEYSIDVLRHNFRDAVFALVRSQESLVAASAAGEVKRFTISGPAAKFGMENVASSHDYAGQKEQLFSLDVHAKSSRVAAAGFNGEVVIWDSESDRRIVRFVASP